MPLIGKALAEMWGPLIIWNADTNLGTPHLTQYKLTPDLWTVVGICQFENCTQDFLLPTSLSEGSHSSPPGLQVGMTAPRIIFTLEALYHAKVEVLGGIEL